MAERPVEILLVEHDPQLAEMIREHLQAAMWAEVTHCPTADVAIREELTTRHEVVITDLTLPDADGLTLVHELRMTNPGPVILLADDPTIDDAREAIRLKVTELLIKPFDLADLSGLVESAAESERAERQRRHRYRRARRIARRIVDERQDLHLRMDLICRDFVQAYRRLAQKVAESGQLNAHSSK